MLSLLRESCNICKIALDTKYATGVDQEPPAGKIISRGVAGTVLFAASLYTCLLVQTAWHGRANILGPPSVYLCVC